MTVYAELQITSNFSFLRGGSHPEELVLRAAELGLSAIALTDRNTLAGVVRAHLAAKEVGIRFVVGARLDLMPGENQAARSPAAATKSADPLGSPAAATDSGVSSPDIGRSDPALGSERDAGSLFPNSVRGPGKLGHRQTTLPRTPRRSPEMMGKPSRHRYCSQTRATVVRLTIC